MSPLHRRWNSKATSSASTSNLSNPLVNRTNTQRSAYSTTTAATGATNMSNTTFLPEFHSTPPMPTLQKPHSTITGTPTPLRTNTTTFSVTDFDTSPTENTFLPRQKSKSPPPPPQPIFDNIQRRPTAGFGHLRAGSAHMLRGCKSTIDIRDRLPNTPEMPAEWVHLHDRAICILDTREYTHEEMVKKMKSSFPELERKYLSPAMIDKQLRIMDQKVEIPYWRVGIAALDKEMQKEKEKEKRGHTLSPRTAKNGDKSQSPSKIPRRSGEARPTPSATQDRSRSPTKIPRKRDSAQELWALMQQKEAEELAKIAARDKAKRENWRPRDTPSPGRGAFPVRSKDGDLPVIRSPGSRSDLDRINNFNAERPQR